MLLPAPGPPLGSLRRPRAGRVTLGCVVHREALSFPPMGATFLPKANMTEEDCPGIIKICGFGMKGSYWYFIPRLNLLSQLILTALDHLNWENGTGKKNSMWDSLPEKDAKMPLSHAQFSGSAEGLQHPPTELTLTERWAGDIRALWWMACCQRSGAES